MTEADATMPTVDATTAMDATTAPAMDATPNAAPMKGGAVIPTAAASTHTRWEDVPVERMSDRIGRQFLVGTDVMIARVLLARGAHVPRHAHANEQVTYILSGALRFAIEGREIVVGAGEVLCIPPNVPHEAWAMEDTVDLDVFNPPRQDWIDRDDSYLRQQSGSEAASEGAGMVDA